jgi:ATP-dependent Lhr-like helicase
VLAATDPANPWGAALPWPESASATRPQRAAGARVVIREGALLAVTGRGDRSLVTFLPPDEPERTEAARALAAALAAPVEEGKKRAALISRIDGEDPASSPLAPFLSSSGFVRGSRGWLKRAAPGGAVRPSPSASADLPTPDA